MSDNQVLSIGNLKVKSPPALRSYLAAGNKSNAGTYAVTNWTSQVAAAVQSWETVCWSPDLGLFCALSSDGANRVMISSDGINWSLHSSSLNSTWASVCWASSLGLFVAVDIGSVHTIHSADGVNWFQSGVNGSNTWTSVCWSPELSLLVAVAKDNAGTTPSTRVMTSSNASSWTARTPAEVNAWQSVCWSPELGLFCAVSSDGTHQVMTSPDGTNWTARTAAAVQTWQSICWSGELGIFVAISNDGAAMSSPDGITWTTRSIGGNNWKSICWASDIGLFAAVAADGTLQTSTNGINWITRTIPAANAWTSICWAPELSMFCAVATSGMNFNGSNEVLISRRYLPSSATSNGSFESAGDAQAATYIERVITTNASSTNMFLDGNGFSQTLQLPAQFVTWYFKAVIVAKSVPAADEAVFTFEGVAQRTPSAQSSVLLIGGASKTIVYASAGASTWDLGVSVDVPTDSLAFSVSGAVATTIQWVAKIDIVQNFAAS